MWSGPPAARPQCHRASAPRYLALRLGAGVLTSTATCRNHFNPGHPKICVLAVFLETSALPIETSEDLITKQGNGCTILAPVSPKYKVELFLVHPRLEMSSDHLLRRAICRAVSSGRDTAVLFTQITTHIMCTTAPQPENASRSMAFMSVCEIVSNKSSASWKSNSRAVSIFIPTSCGQWGVGGRAWHIGGVRLPEHEKVAHQVGLP